MHQVICVAALQISFLPEWAKGKTHACPEIGSEYCCEAEIYDTVQNIVWLELKEFPNQQFDARAFAELPKQTADEINAQHKEAILM